MALLTKAYDAGPYQVLGPAWLAQSEQQFEIAATVPQGASQDHLKLMLQNLLVERFHLQLHHEIASDAGLRIDGGKNGPKVKESIKAENLLEEQKHAEPDANGAVAVGRPDETGYPTLPPWFTGLLGRLSNGHMLVAGSRVDPLGMTGFLRLDHPVVDHTGLTGEYDFKLDVAWTGRGGVAPQTDEASDPAPFSRQPRSRISSG